jgi:hypothetical protein
MLDPIKNETERIDSRFLGQRAGAGLRRPHPGAQSAIGELKFGKSDFEKRHYALLAFCAVTELSC